MRQISTALLILFISAIATPAQVTDSVVILKHRTSWNICIAWSPDGSKVVAGGLDASAIVWDATSGASLFTFREHDNDVMGLAWRPDGKMIATASADSKLMIWYPDRTTGRFTMSLHSGYVRSVRWNADGSRLVTAGNDGRVIICDAEGAKKSWCFHDKAVPQAEWSPDGRTIATISVDTARIWDATTGRVIHILAGHTLDIMSVAWSPDGRFVATTGKDNTVRIWNADSGTLRHTLEGTGYQVEGADWSPNGERLVTFGGNIPDVWDVESGQRLHLLRGHNKSVNDVEWSPDGRYIATAGDDTSAIIWDGTTGALLQRLRGHVTGILHVKWSPAGPPRLLTSAGDTTSRIWYLEPVSRVEDHRVRSREATSGIIGLQPNPPASTGEIEFRVLLGGDVRLDLVDMLGQQVRSLFEGELPPGYHIRSVDLEGLAPGRYYLQLRAPDGHDAAPCDIVK